MRGALAGLVLWAATGCTVEDVDITGRACDETHACQGNRRCQVGRCVDPATPLPDTRPGWFQTRDGFASTVVCPTCRLELIEPGRALSASIASTVDSTDFAYGQVNGAALPAATEGKLMGSFTLPAPNPLEGDSTLVILQLASVGASPLFQCYVSPNLSLNCSSCAGCLQPTSLFVPTSTFSVVPGRAQLLELSWRAGAFFRVALDGTQTANIALDQPWPIPEHSQLRLGVYEYRGPSTHFTMTFSGWQLVPDADARWQP